ncbi:hypothetical protein Y017_02400 [Alcanivorax sp. 97CO-5]|nr:hypothetical protein Y017_02400 [Alcanivorax sp. 97CO-5]PKG03056.1 hypothetical protein Y019_02370 [Alcanivorax sp. 97CO-6]
MLMVYELLVVSILIFVLERKYWNKKSRALFVSEKKVLPVWFGAGLAAASIFLVVFFPQALLFVNFIYPKIVSEDYSVTSLAIFVAMLLMTSKVLLVVFFLKAISMRKNKSNLYAWLALLVCLVNISIFFGTNRIAVILTAVATMIIFMRLYPRVSLIKASLVGVAVFGLFGLITSEREYVSKSDSHLVSMADQIQGYTGGIYNVAIGAEVSVRYPEASKLEVLIYDFLRPTMGLNILVSDWDVKYSNIYFNDRMWVNVDRRSQIIPMISQGYLFLPFIFAPLLSCFFVFIGYYLMGFLSSVVFLEVHYFLLLCVMRIGFFWGQNSMNMMNYLSMNLLLPLIILFLYKVLVGLGRRDYA